MSGVAVVLVSAAVAGLLVVVMPALLRRLPEPVDDPPEVSYAVLSRPGWVSTGSTSEDDGGGSAAGRWVVPGGVVAGAVIAALLGWRVQPERLMLFLTPLVPVLLLLAYVDARVRLLPRLPILAATAAGVVLLAGEWLATRDTTVLVRGLAGLVLAMAIFWLLWRLRRSAMGFGDVRLAALVGLVLGRLGWAHWLVGLYGGLTVFALWAIARALLRRSREAMREPLPYGPFMILGMLFGIVAG